MNEKTVRQMFPWLSDEEIKKQVKIMNNAKSIFGTWK